MMDKLGEVIEAVVQQAAQIQILGRELSQAEQRRLHALQTVEPFLRTAYGVLSDSAIPAPSPTPAPPSPDTPGTPDTPDTPDTPGTPDTPEPAQPGDQRLITYKIVSDLDGLLKQSARVACNFWNHFLEPKTPIVIRLGVFTEQSRTIARAYHPYQRNGIKYGRVEFNTEYLSTYTPNEIAGTLVHEIGHTLGIGWDIWDTLYDRSKGLFSPQAIDKLPALEPMRVETDGGPGTQYSHWDEQTHDKELMTGYKDHAEHVLPVTIAVMPLLGHRVRHPLETKTSLTDLLDQAAQVVFTRHASAKALDRDYFQPTDIVETIPSRS